MRILRFMLTVVAVTLVASVSSAEEISFNFAYGQGGASGTSVSGEAGITGNTIWNNYNGNNTDPAPGVTGSETGALNNLGVATTADVSWASQQTWNNDSGAGENSNLLNGYIDDNGTSGDPLGVFGVNVDVVNIPYATYDVHVYFNNDFGDGDVGLFDMDVNGTTFATTGAFTQAHAGVIDAGNSITVTGLSGALNLSSDQRTNPGISTITGFEIVNATAIPEPTSLAWLGMGLVGMAVRRRRR